MKLFVCCLLFYSSYLVSLTSCDVYIIIHGTWAKTSSWAKPGGDFFDALQHSVGNTTDVVSFSWSGNFDNISRRQAGHDLATFIMSNYPASTKFHLIGHSHGVNVGILACKALAHHARHYHISTFYALAAPVNTQEYMPPMHIIDYFYSFFSLNDLVQPIFGIFDRLYPEHPRISNIRITIDGNQPDHDQLHNPCIARSLLHIHEHRLEHFFDGTTPPIIDFFSTRNYRISRDYERDEALAQDRQIIKHLLTVFRGKIN